MNIMISAKNVTANLLPTNILLVVATTLLAVPALGFDRETAIIHDRVDFRINMLTTKIIQYFDKIIKRCAVSTDKNKDLVKQFSQVISLSKDELVSETIKFKEYAKTLLLKQPGDKVGDMKNRKTCGFKYVEAFKKALEGKLNTVKTFMEDSFSQDLNITLECIEKFMAPTKALASKFKKSHEEALKNYMNVTLPLAKGRKFNVYGINEKIITFEEDLMQDTKTLLEDYVTEAPNQNNEAMRLAPNVHEYIRKNIEHLRIVARTITDEIKMNEVKDGEFYARGGPKAMPRIAQKQVQKSCVIDLSTYQLTDMFGYSVISENLGTHEMTMRNLAKYFSTADKQVIIESLVGGETKKWKVGIQRVKKNITKDFTESFTYIDDKVNFHVTEMGTDNTILIEHIGLLEGDSDLKKKSHAVYNFVRVLHASMGELVNNYCRRYVNGSGKWRRTMERLFPSGKNKQEGKMRNVVEQARTASSDTLVRLRSRRSRSRVVTSQEEYFRRMEDANYVKHLGMIVEEKVEEKEEEETDEDILYASNL